ncbi:MAG: endolytic transglycosylase MltG [Methylococcaceae bacterium]
MVNRIFGIILLVLIFAGRWAWTSYQSAIKTPLVFGNPIIVEIEKGDSFNQITDKLLAQNLAINPLWFKVAAIQQNAMTKLKTGEYELTAGLTMPDILALFVLGRTKQYAITFPEGWSFKQILLEVENNPHLEHTLANADSTEIMSRLGTNISQPEGEFFPDTYFFEKHTTDIALLKRAYDKMQSVMQQEWLNKVTGLPFKTPYEALILASIVEKETGAKFERPLIAGVFLRRLQTGMLLQTDPTVIYGMGDNYHGDIGFKDLKTATPYNTYMIKGLPPTPIAMPGRDSIHAVLHPDNSNNLYFVSRGDGTHEFSTTLKDHNLAVDNLQRNKK